MTRNNADLRKDAAEALCCLAHALGEEFTIFVPSIRKILVKHQLRVLVPDFVHILCTILDICLMLVISYSIKSGMRLKIGY